MEPRHPIRAAIAVSVLGHLALAVGVYFADARPFDPSTAEIMAVDLVTPDEAAAIAKPPEATPPEPPKPPDPFRLPDLTKPTTETGPQAAAKPSSRTAQQPPAQPLAAPAQPPQQQPPSQQAAQPQQQPPAQSPPSPPPQQQAALQPPPPSQTQTQTPASPATPEPDITVKYGVMLGLPDAGGASVSAKADIAPLDIAAFRRHLRTCSTLPSAVAPSDKVRIVLRAFLAPNGRLIAEPTLIEASASAKGPLLMQAAMRALQDCQPYAMLPADKYKEWKVLDLAFTPQDFAG